MNLLLHPVTVCEDVSWDEKGNLLDIKRKI